ncbi:E3 ubiquitin-protein ligase RNF169 [Crotalus tigris]|uniref:E3 ubiquitin-protein ligase RNF169 n=1 Tax=Crotalus tigris TaxID=88082 RepID=UPI00192F9EB3|nr:E3 ubiquitin-protein ligase RNF169 [Crotalus tigris]
MAAAGGPGGRDAGSSVPTLRRGRGRRRRVEACPADADGAPETPARRWGQWEGPAGDPGPPRDFIFRTPVTLAKHGDVQEEYKSHLRKLRHEKWAEDKKPEDLIHKLMADDAEVDRRRMDDQKKEESLMGRVSHERFPECLSDSENEEPSQGRPAYRSAFVSKGNAYPITSLAGNFSSKVKRSQSCNDTLGNRSKSRQRSAPVRTKVNPSAGASVSLLGVLSSTQNNRCLSAPDLTAEKRLVLPPQAPSSFPVLPRQERSISPESNDSISEELNHFKPIVCSPCTPPKQLPDGRVLSPLIIKSTPRNLTRSLQKPTTYEASPWILKKWERILQDRQVKKTLCKATLTSSAPEPGEPPNLPLPVKCPLPMSSLVSLPDSLPLLSVAKCDRSANGRRDSEATELTPHVLPPRAAEKPPNSGISEPPKAKTAPRLAGPCLHYDAKTSMARKVVRVNSALENGSLPAERKPRRYWDESELRRLSNGLRLERGLGEETPSLRRGQKRPCKTKHLDPSVKRLRPSAACRKGPPVSDSRRQKRQRPPSRTEQRLQQEEADRRLAVQLQRQFERESRTLERPKGRAEQYFLRSKNVTGAK